MQTEYDVNEQCDELVGVSMLSIILHYIQQTKMYYLVKPLKNI